MPRAFDLLPDHVNGARRSIGVVVIVALLLSSVPNADGAANAGTSSTPFIIGLPGLPVSLNPLTSGNLATADVTDSVFDSLLSADVHDALQPDLAARYSISPDGLQYRFQLNPRARWQDGTPVTAADVLYTTHLMRDPQFPAYNRYGFGEIKTIAAVGTATVTVTLQHPFAPFLRAFATTAILPAHVLSLIPDAQVAHYQTFNRKPLGSGPYEVVEYSDADHITLTANPDYFRGAPHLPTLEFKVEGSESTALQAIKSGAIDMLGPSVGIAPAHLLDALGTGHLNAYATPGFGWTHIDLIESGFLRDHIVRQALAYATPRQHIIATIFKGLVSQADADQPPTSQYYEPAIAGSYPYDPARVPALLFTRGFKRVGSNFSKFNTTLRITLWLDESCTDCISVARAVAAGWIQAGIPTTVRAVPTKTLFGQSGPLYSPHRLQSTQLNAVLYTWVTQPEPDDSAYWSSSMIVRPGNETGLNFDGYNDPVVDQLSSRALTTASDAKRIYDYQAIQRLLVRDQPDIFLYWMPHLSIALDTLHGYEANPFHPGITWDVAQWLLQ